VRVRMSRYSERSCSFMARK